MIIDPKTREAPGPGVYRGVPQAHYHGWPYASSSRLKTLRRSAKKLKHERDNPQPMTEAQIFGAAAHTATFEPDTFGDWFVQRPEGRGNSNAFKDAKAKILRDQPQVNLLKPDEIEKVWEIRELVWNHPSALPLLHGADFELSIVWDEPVVVRIDGKLDEYMVRCKARIDVLNGEDLADLKTTKDAEEEAFGKQAWDLDYHRQLALYNRAVLASDELDVKPKSLWIMAVEKEEPLDMAVFQLPSAWHAKGDLELDILLEQWALCEITGVWPGYPTRPRELQFPGYAGSQWENRFGGGGL